MATSIDFSTLIEQIEWEIMRGAANIVLRDGLKKEAAQLAESSEKARTYRRWLKAMQNRKEEQ